MPVGSTTCSQATLVFTRSYRDAVVTDLGHVAIVVGGGMAIVTPHTGAAVHLQPVDAHAVQAVRRVLR